MEEQKEREREGRGVMSDEEKKKTGTADREERHLRRQEGETRGAVGGSD